MIGKTLGHYRVVEKIGAGGMGEVYRARDERLERDVAVKVLPAGTLADGSARKRFRKEALALSKLNHPNIATVFDFDTQDGVDFLVMEHIAGLALSEKLGAGPLAEKEIARLGMQMAEGLAAAHAQNVIHRDLKPGNLRLTPDGRLKVLDFGLAKLLRPAPDEAVTAESLSQSQLGAAAGTLPYMAPEQLRGEEVDARTDIYAAGCVLYELATGQRPFPVTQGPKLIDAILHQSPVPPRDLNPHVSPGLETVILKALDKEPDRRYQSARDLRADLDRLAAGLTVAATPRPQPAWRLPPLAAGAVILALAVLVSLNVGRMRERLFGTAAPKIESLAVLPLENLSRDPEQEYFADGMTEALIAELSTISALKVISRTSAMQYKGARKPLPQIARELNVDALVEGAVLRERNRVRINLQMYDGATDRRIWGGSYEREMVGILALQGEVAQAVAGEIRIALTPREQSRLATVRPVNPDAYEAYLRGRHSAAQWDIVKSLEYFDRAIQLDPAYAPAYAGQADSYAAMAFAANAPPRDFYAKAKEAARKALELDETLAEAHASMGDVNTAHDWDWRAAEREYRRAIELSPSYPVVHFYYSTLLSVLGRHEEAIAEARRGRELDPVSPLMNVNLGWRFHSARDYPRALEQYQRTLELDPNYAAARQNLAAVYTELGRYDEALAELKKLGPLGDHPVVLAELGRTYALSGRRKEALRARGRIEALSKRSYVSSYWAAALSVALGDNDQALARLEQAHAERDAWLIFLNGDPRFDAVRSDPRFQALLRRMNFPE